jgi:hypothetical protein
MYIHSLFNDIGLSVSALLDNYILQDSKYIKRYEFNTGTRTFQLEKDYKVNFDLPTCMVTINDETPSFGQRTETLLQQRMFNMNQLPVLYNRTNNRVLFLQEESANIPITVSINCESQFQAKELSHVIKRYLPLNKWISIFDFTSFIEVSNIFLSNFNFDPNEHDILNLFVKPNDVLGQVDYCFSLKYTPMIRLESISASSPDSTQRSYSCQFDMTYMMQWPMFLFSTQDDKPIETLNVSMSMGRDTPILDFPAQKYINPYLFSDEFIKKRTRKYTQQEIQEASGYVFDSKILDETALRIIGEAKKLGLDINDFMGIVRRNLLISTTDQFKVHETQSGIYLIVHFDPKDFKIQKYYSYNVISGKDEYNYNYPIETLNPDDNKVTFKFSSEFWDKCKPTPTNPLLIQIYDPTITKIMGKGGWLNISVS